MPPSPLSMLYPPDPLPGEDPGPWPAQEASAEQYPLTQSNTELDTERETEPELEPEHEPDPNPKPSLELEFEHDSASYSHFDYDSSEDMFEHSNSSEYSSLDSLLPSRHQTVSPDNGPSAPGTSTPGPSTPAEGSTNALLSSESSSQPLHYHIPSLETRIVVHTLRHYAHWSYPRLHQQFDIPLSTLHRIVHSARTPSNETHPPRGHHRIIDSALRQQLVNTATASAHNHS